MCADIMKLVIEVDDRGSGVVRNFQQTASKVATDLNRTGSPAVQNFSKHTGNMSTALGGATRTLSAFLGPIGLAVTGVGAVGTAFISTARTIGGFDQSMANVKAVTQATGSEMKAMTATARELGATTEFSASQAASGMEFLGRAGFTTTQIIQSMPATLNLATAGALSLSNAADIASNVMAGFGISASEFSSAADVIAATASSANTSVEQLGQAMSFVAPVAGALSIDIDDTAAALGVLSNAGIQASSAGTGLRRILSELASPTKAATDVLQTLGLRLSDLNPATNSLVEIVRRLKTANIDAAQAFQVFGDRGAPAILALTSQLPELEGLTSELGNAEGRAKEMADVMRDTIPGAGKEFLSVLQELQHSMGDAGLTEAIRGVLAGGTSFLKWVDSGVDKIPTFIKHIKDAGESLKGLATDTVAFVKSTDAFKEVEEKAGTLSRIFGGLAKSLGFTGNEKAEIDAIGAELDALKVSAEAASPAVKTMEERIKELGDASKTVATSVGAMASVFDTAEESVDVLSDNSGLLRNAIIGPDGLRHALEDLSTTTNEVRASIIRADGSVVDMTTTVGNFTKATGGALVPITQLKEKVQASFTEAADAAVTQFKKIVERGDHSAQALRDIFVRQVWPKIVNAGQTSVDKYQDLFAQLKEAAQQTGDVMQKELGGALRAVASETDKLRQALSKVKFDQPFGSTTTELLRSLEQQAENVRRSPRLSEQGARGFRQFTRESAVTAQSIIVEKLVASGIPLDEILRRINIPETERSLFEGGRLALDRLRGSGTTTSGFQQGGIVPGVPTPGRDSVLAALEPGELVVPRQTVNRALNVASTGPMVPGNSAFSLRRARGREEARQDFFRRTQVHHTELTEAREQALRNPPNAGPGNRQIVLQVGGIQMQNVGLDPNWLDSPRVVAQLSEALRQAIRQGQFNAELKRTLGL